MSEQIWDMFTDHGRLVLKMASIVAKEFKCQYIGPEHMLIAMTKRDNPAKTILQRLGVTTEMVERELRNMLGE